MEGFEKGKAVYILVPVGLLVGKSVPGELSGSFTWCPYSTLLSKDRNRALIAREKEIEGRIGGELKRKEHDLYSFFADPNKGITRLFMDE